MDRFDLPLHHECRPAFFRALRAAIFILDDRDRERAKKFAKKRKGRNGACPSKNPNPSSCLREYKGCDRLTGKKYPLFKDRHWKKRIRFRPQSKEVTTPIRRDQCHSFTGKQPQTSDSNRQRWSANFRLLRCYQQDSGNASGLGHGFWALFSGPRYSNNLLAEVRHRSNCRMSEKYRQEFSDDGHYDGQKIDTVNSLHMTLFACLKYPK
jgi:hypothetical protein